MSLWLAGDEQIESVSNDGGVITYDLGTSSGQPGDRILFKSKLNAEWGGELELIPESFPVVESTELAAGVQIYSQYELWDVGLLAELSRIENLSFEGAMNVSEAQYDIKTVANVFRFIVNPDDGVDIYSGETLAAHVDRPGYYLFLSNAVAVYEAEPSTVD